MVGTLGEERQVLVDQLGPADTFLVHLERRETEDSFVSCSNPWLTYRVATVSPVVSAVAVTRLVVAQDELNVLMFHDGLVDVLLELRDGAEHDKLL